MKLSFIILAYKERDLLRLCIKNILNLGLEKHGMSYEIIFVDNGSKNGLPEMVKQLYPSVRTILNGKNLGHPGGNNPGLKSANGEYSVMINPDIIFRDAEDIKRIVAYLDEHKDVGILGPKLCNADGSIQNSCYRRYSKWTPMYRRTFIGKLPFAKRDIERHLMTDFDHHTTIDVEWLLGACFFIRKSAMEKVGYMDDAFFLYFGDYEWCDRMQHNGYRVVYYADTNGIFHYHQRESASSRFTVLQLFSYVTRIHIRDWTTYLRKTQHYAKSA
jgi:GT2 family glycosyltransferase